MKIFDKFLLYDLKSFQIKNIIWSSVETKNNKFDLKNIVAERYWACFSATHVYFDGWWEKNSMEIRVPQLTQASSKWGRTCATILSLALAWPCRKSDWSLFQDKYVSIIWIADNFQNNFCTVLCGNFFKCLF